MAVVRRVRWHAGMLRAGRGIVAARFNERDTFSGQRVRSWSIIMQRAAKTEHSCARYCGFKSVAAPSSAAHHRHFCSKGRVNGGGYFHVHTRALTKVLRPLLCRCARGLRHKFCLMFVLMCQ